MTYETAERMKTSGSTLAAADWLAPEPAHEADDIDERSSIWKGMSVPTGDIDRGVEDRRRGAQGQLVANQRRARDY